MKNLEIILPLRNPTVVIEKTLESLIHQSDRRFSVLLSDNHSTQGHEFFELVIERLQAVGIIVRKVAPPIELGRVEHWNWAHHIALGDWLKPIFAGDWLELDYVAKLRTAAASNPECSYIFSAYVLHRMDTPPEVIESMWAGRFRNAEEMNAGVLRYGMRFGPPSSAAYKKTSFIALGGYPTALPICSDSLLFCQMAARFGAYGFCEALCHFNIHGSRFSTNLLQRRKDTFRETLLYCLMLGYSAWVRARQF